MTAASHPQIPLIDEFLQAMSADRGLARNSLDAYRRDLEAAARSAGDADQRKGEERLSLFSHRSGGSGVFCPDAPVLCGPRAGVSRASLFTSLFSRLVTTHRVQHTTPSRATMCARAVHTALIILILCNTSRMRN